MNKWVFFIWIFFLSLSAKAVEGNVEITRICLNRLDSTATIFWKRPTDNCGSFDSYVVYGREDVAFLFTRLDTFLTFNVNSVSVKLPNLKKWEFYVVTKYACNLTDSLESNHVFLDNEEPSAFSLDSVSVDFVTQKALIGWPANPATDVRGYYIYHVTSTNAVIKDTFSLGMHDNVANRNPNNGPVKYSISAYDSCYNTSPISTEHVTIYLTRTLNYCNKTIFLNWTPYIGWPAVSDYEIFVSENNGPFLKIGNTNGSITGFLFNFNNYGNSYRFYVRAKKQGNNITSSSNVVSISVPIEISPAINYLAYATVRQNSYVELEYLQDTSVFFPKFLLYRSANNLPFVLIDSLNNQTTSGIKYKDRNTSVQNTFYRYLVQPRDICYDKKDSSNKANTILLTGSATSTSTFDLNWNLYNTWQNGTGNYQIIFEKPFPFAESSTWNNLNTYPPTAITALEDVSAFGLNEPKCFCVIATENGVNSFNRLDSSYSNYYCISAKMQVYFPNAFRPDGGYNPVFLPKGTFIDYEKSYYQIFNRWGQMVFETSDLRIGWDGKLSNGNLSEEGVYVFRGIVRGFYGEEEIVQGVIHLMR